MIRSIRVTKGYAAELSRLKKQTIKLQLGLTILFGPNGCGKTTLIKLLGYGTGCRKDGGWSTFVEPFYLHKPFPEVFFHASGMGCTANVDWDGTASFMHMAAVSDSPIIYFGEERDGLLNDVEQLQLAMGGHSVGEGRLLRLQKLLLQLRDTKVPDLGGLQINANESWKEAVTEFVTYVKTLPRTGPPTVLLDEPDRSLSIPNQADLWQILSEVAKKLQVIVATHSPLALNIPEASYVEFKPGYLEQCRKILLMVASEGRTT